ncbi:glutamate receptor 3-like [Macrobrachium rosenbergii]|uniref:glutamate receptor 3-like n=1 Tax=Macrobrachium rosenbergii TaxID=79674 RepID=UPI0034D74C4E
MCLSMFFVFRHSPYSEEKPLSEIIWLIVAAFCNAGETVFAVSISSRLLVLVLYLTTMMLHAYYNSFLISSLTVEKTYLPFTDLQGLYEAKTYSFGVGYGSSKEDYLKMSHIPLHKSIWNEMVLADPLNLSPSIPDLMERVCTHKHASLISRISLRKQLWPCSIFLLPGTYFPHPTTMPIQKDSPLTSTFQFQMRKLSEAGIMRRLEGKWTPNAMESPDSGKTPISILQASTAFCLTLIGHLAALAILAMEIVFAKWQRTKQHA